MRILGLDVGDKRIGLAISDPMEILASLLAVVERKSNGSEHEAILALASEHEVGKIVVGLPRLMNGSLGSQAEKTKAFVDELVTRTNIPVVMYDERFSTSTASDLLRTAGKKRHQIKKQRDTAAAALILQWYLDEHNNKQERSP